MEYAARSTGYLARRLQYYTKFGDDIDFDGIFIIGLLDAMATQHWDMNHDYSDVCIQIRKDTWGDENE